MGRGRAAATERRPVQEQWLSLRKNLHAFCRAPGINPTTGASSCCLLVIHNHCGGITPGAAATCPSAAGVPATACSPPQALGPVGVVCGRACVHNSLSLHQQAYTWCSGLARPRAPALQCLDVFLGAGELPRRLVFSCVCACLLYTSPSPRDRTRSRMPSSA